MLNKLLDRIRFLTTTAIPCKNNSVIILRYLVTEKRGFKFSFIDMAIEQSGSKSDLKLRRLHLVKKNNYCI